jgi:hypothetical protein
MNPGCVTVEKPTKVIYWTGRTRYAGATLCAYQCLAKRFAYTIVYCEKANVNCFWMRNDVLTKLFGINIGLFKRVLDNSFLRPFNLSDTADVLADGKWHQVTC